MPGRHRWSSHALIKHLDLKLKISIASSHKTLLQLENLSLRLVVEIKLKTFHDLDFKSRTYIKHLDLKIKTLHEVSTGGAHTPLLNIYVLSLRFRLLVLIRPC